MIETVPASDFLKRLGVANPIIQGPMGGGPSTPELVAAVSNAGGLGSLGAAYLSPDQIIETTRRIRSLTGAPFQVNLFAGGWDANARGDSSAILEILGEIHRDLGLPAPQAPTPKPDPFPDHFAALLEARPPIFSFTFGIPRPADLARLRERGIVILGTATSLAEAKLLADAGVDGIVAQGAESGAHRGTFAGPFDQSMVPTLELVRQIAGLVDLPVIAAGGLMDGRDVRAALEAGASAVALGTAFLVTPESGAPAAHKQAILDSAVDNTVITSAFSGRPARGIPNVFVQRLASRPDAILPYPLQNALTRAMRGAAAQQGRAEFLSLWAGQGVARARAIPAGALVNKLLDEM